MSQKPCECQVSRVPCKVVEGFRNYPWKMPYYNARVLFTEVSTYRLHVPVVGVTTLLDHDEFFANMWLPTCPVYMVATNCRFNN